MLAQGLWGAHGTPLRSVRESSIPPAEGQRQSKPAGCRAACERRVGSQRGSRCVCTEGPAGLVSAAGPARSWDRERGTGKGVKGERERRALSRRLFSRGRMRKESTLLLFLRVGSGPSARACHPLLLQPPQLDLPSDVHFILMRSATS